MHEAYDVPPRTFVPTSLINRYEPTVTGFPPWPADYSNQALLQILILDGLVKNQQRCRNCPIIVSSWPSEQIDISNFVAIIVLRILVLSTYHNFRPPVEVLRHDSGFDL